MFAADKFAKAKISIQEMSFTKTIFVGFMQCLALMPGVSRSGSTISGAMFMGLKREEAAKFSFLLGLPAVAGAGLLAVKDMFEAGFDDISISYLAVGFAVSFASGYFAIDFLIKFLQKQSMTVFVIYRLLLAAYLLICF
jgi:undecaprenyl-diphosphatase